MKTISIDTRKRGRPAQIIAKRGRPAFRNYETSLTIRIPEVAFEHLHLIHDKRACTWNEFLLHRLLKTSTNLLQPMCPKGTAVTVEMTTKQKLQLRLKYDQFCAGHGLWDCRGKMGSFNTFLFTLLVKGI